MSSPIYIFAATNYVTVFLVTHTHIHPLQFCRYCCIPCMQMDTSVHVNKAWCLHIHDIKFWTLFIIITVTRLKGENYIIIVYPKSASKCICNFLFSDKFNWSHWRIYSPKWKFQTLNEPSPGWIGVLKVTLQNQPLHITYMNVRFLRKCKISPKNTP